MNRLKIRSYIINQLKKNDYLFFLVKYWRLRILMIVGKLISDKKYIEWQYWLRTGKHLNLIEPHLYNEKVQYTKLYYRDDSLKKLVDKYEVREYVNQKIGNKYLTKLYGIYNNVDEIDFDNLPERFVVKLTNGSGYNYICKRKTDREIRKIKRRFRKWIKIDFYMLGREWAYKDVKNRIICEEYLENDKNQGLYDYKIFCFAGKAELIQVDYDRFNNHKRNFYTTEWKFVNEIVEYDNDKDANIPKPLILDEMLDNASILSADYPHVRVDFYIINNKLFFGEMTFYHGAGYLHFGSEQFERKLGDMWELLA